MGLGPSGSLPHHYFCIVLPYILAINSVFVCIQSVHISSVSDGTNSSVL